MDVIVVEIEGGIDDFPLLVQTVDNLIADGERRLVLDLHTLPLISSAALGYLIKASKAIRREGGHLVLARLQPALSRILRMTNLEGLLPAFESVEGAVAHLHAEGGERAPSVRRAKVGGVESRGGIARS